MSSQDSADLTTDAVPNPNRNPDISKDTRPEECEEETKEFEEEISSTNVKNPFKGFAKYKKSRIPTAQATIINISNSNGIHVGDKFVYNVNDRSEKPLKHIKETDAIRKLKKSMVPLQRDDMLFIASHMNSEWKDTFRELNYSDGQIDQFYGDHHHLGLKEVIFQLLFRWSQNEPDVATIGKICEVLWNNNQQELVKNLSKRKE